MKINIAKEEDRLTVAAILVKNGYTVAQDREKPLKGKAYTYFLVAENRSKKNES